MQAFRHGDPRPYRGATALDLLAAMRADSPHPEASLQAWMEAWSTRLCRWDGGPPVDCSSPARFLVAMQARGQIVDA